MICALQQMVCLDVDCGPISLSFSKNEDDVLNETLYTVQTGSITDNAKCEDFRMETSERHFVPTNQIASCPWTYVRTVDENRVPNVLWEARCVCRCGVNAADCHYYRCMPVYTYIKVLRRLSCMDIRPEFFPLAVGCTQVRRIRRVRYNEMQP
jgi:hypothetical protein